MKHIALYLAGWVSISHAQAQQTVQAQETSLKAELRGRVTTLTETPLAGVEVTILRDALSATTDTAGRFLLRAVSPGKHMVRVRRIGFLPQYLSVTLRAGERREVAIVLAPGVYQLPDIETSELPSKPIEYAYTTKYDEFFRRQRIGLGHYISRQDIDRKSAGETADLLMGIPGVVVIPGAPGIRRTSVRIRTCQKVSVWLDGVELQTYGSNGGSSIGRSKELEDATAELLDRILPIQIEMIEVYAGPAQMPAEAVGNSCAAIMIWTR